MIPSETSLRIGSLVEMFGDFAEVLGGTGGYFLDSDLDMDHDLARSVVVPVLVVNGLANSVGDHLDAWVTKSHDGHTGVFADFTLFRPVVESLAAIIWILGAAESKDRISRTIQFVNIELRKGKRLVSDLQKAGGPDQPMQNIFNELEDSLLQACENVGLEHSTCMPERPLDPSKLTKKAAQYVPGPTLDTYKFWALCSAHAHSQMFTVLSKANVHRHNRPDGNLYNLYELFDFVAKLLGIAVGLLEKRGSNLGEVSATARTGRTR
ncbi:hypothetical protein [Cryobacterium sp. W22_MBD10_FK3]|uniref:hypothetical protein n=1 Tax=Cryobacterium sp. W22_MBD10_FK3 TaxID=3240273 RepID=UPI003F8DD4AE